MNNDIEIEDAEEQEMKKIENNENVEAKEK